MENLEEQRRVQAIELEALRTRIESMMQEKARLAEVEEERHVQAIELEAEKVKGVELAEEKSKLEKLLEEERQVQASELEALETKMQVLAEEKLKLEKLLVAAGEASDEGAALGSRLEEISGALAVAEREKELAETEMLELKIKVAELEESKEALKALFDGALEEKENMVKVKEELLEKLKVLEGDCDQIGEPERNMEKASGEISEMRE